MDTQTIKPTGCCDPFDPEPWQDREITWKDKIFVKDHIASFFHVPLNMGKKVVSNMELIEKAAAKAPCQLMLTDEKSLWGADIYIDVAKDVPGAQMATLSGTFLSKVFEGSYQNAGKWATEMEGYVKSKGKSIEKFFFRTLPVPNVQKRMGKIMSCSWRKQTKSIARVSLKEI